MHRYAAVAAVLAALTAAVFAGGSASAAVPQRPPYREVYRLQDPRIDEASGIAVGIASPGVDYVENDSGDVNRFFALDAASGATAAVVTVPGATNVDWEDIATGRDAARRPCVWLADIGDNAADRSEIRVYRVPEPHVNPHARDRAITTPRAVEWRLRYPDGPVDAESLAIAPDGTGYLVTKSPIGVSQVYRLPARPGRDRVQTLTRVGTIRFRLVAAPSRFGDVASLLATSAGISPDGRLFVVRTYTDADVWRLPTGVPDPVGAALRTRPTRIVLPRQPQGEGLAVRDRSLLLDSEGVHTAVYSLALPAGLPAPPTGVRSSSATPEDGSVVTQAATSTTAGTATRGGAGSTATRDWLLAVLAVALLAGVARVARQRSRHGPRGGSA